MKEKYIRAEAIVQDLLEFKNLQNQIKKLFANLENDFFISQSIKFSFMIDSQHT